MAKNLSSSQKFAVNAERGNDRARADGESLRSIATTSSALYGSATSIR